MPVSQEFLDGRYFERYIKGQIREQTVQIAFTKWLTSPEEFCKIYYEYKDNPNAIDHFFGTAISSLEMAAKKGEEFSEALLKSDGARLGLRQTLIEAGVDKRDAKKLTPAINISYEFDEQKAKMESYFGVGKAEHFFAYVSAIAKGKTSWHSSDLSDLYHFSYSYECDLFRCDMKMANIMADCASIKDKLVAKFSDLPSRIEYQISQRLAKIHSRAKSVQPTPL